jgi:hypothetical protein
MDASTYKIATESLHCPQSPSGSNVKNITGILKWGQKQLVLQCYAEEMVARCQGQRLASALQSRAPELENVP